MIQFKTGQKVMMKESSGWQDYDGTPWTEIGTVVMQPSFANDCSWDSASLTIEWPDGTRDDTRDDYLVLDDLILVIEFW